jgi:hypothetical protein
MDQHFQFQGPPKITQIGIFGLKIYDLATLNCLLWCKNGEREREKGGPLPFVDFFWENAISENFLEFYSIQSNSTGGLFSYRRQYKSTACISAAV